MGLPPALVSWLGFFTGTRGPPVTSRWPSPLQLWGGAQPSPLPHGDSGTGSCTQPPGWRKSK